MPPRAQRLYPRMRERPPEFRINEQWPLRDSLIFAFLGTPPGSRAAISVAHYDVGIMNGTCRYEYSSELARNVVTFIPNAWISFTSRSWFHVTECTLCCFVRRLRTSTREIWWGKGSGSGPLTTDWWLEFTASNTVRFYQSRTKDYSAYSVTPINDTTCWYHIAGVCRNDVLQVYINGKSDGSPVTVSGDIPRTEEPVNIGRLSSAGYYMHGIVSDALICNRGIPDMLPALADPSNVDLRIGGIPLILPPRRRLWPVAPVAEYVKRRQLGLRVGSREAVT